MSSRLLQCTKRTLNDTYNIIYVVCAWTSTNACRYELFLQNKGSLYFSDGGRKCIIQRSTYGPYRIIQYHTVTEKWNNHNLLMLVSTYVHTLLLRIRMIQIAQYNFILFFWREICFPLKQYRTSLFLIDAQISINTVTIVVYFF